MSEKLNISHQPEHLRPNPVELQFGPETGAISFDALTEAYHGVRAFISQKRMERAGNRMERMDHKDALYDDLGEMAVTRRREPETPANTANGERVMPRTFAERWMDRKIDKRGLKKSVADTYAYRARKIYGAEDDPNAGLDKTQKRLRRAGVSYSAHKGRLTTTEARVKKHEIGATRVRHGKDMHKQTRIGVEKTGRKLDRSVDQPILSYWRNWRRNRAIESIKKHHHNAQEHRQRQADARS